MSKPPKIVVPGLNRGAGIPAGKVLGRARGTGQGPAQLLDGALALQALGGASGPALAQNISSVVSQINSLSTAISLVANAAASVLTALDGQDGYDGYPIPGPTGPSSGTQTLFVDYADAGNTTTTETDLYTHSIAGGQLAANGDRIDVEWAGTFVSSGTATRQIRCYFGGTLFFDSGALTISVSGAEWKVTGTITRVSATVVRCTFAMLTEGATLADYTQYTEVTGLTLANANTLKITGTAAGAGAATNDIVAKAGSMDYRPLSTGVLLASSGSSGGGRPVTRLPVWSLSSFSQAAACRGNRIVPATSQNIATITAVWDSVSGVTYKAGIAPFDNSTQKFTSACTYTDTYTPGSSITGDYHVFTFTSAYALTAGSSYIIFFQRTDSASGTMVCYYNATTFLYADGLGPQASGASKYFAGLTPGTSDVWTNETGQYMIIPNV